MAEYAKKLHIRKSGVVTDIKLYSTTGEVGANYLVLRDGSNVMYAKLDATSNSLASDLRVRKTGNIYAVCKQALPAYTKVQYTSVGTFTFTAPQGISKVRVTVAGAGGGSGGGIYVYREKGGNISRSGGAGGRGALVASDVSVTAGQTFTLVVGAGGAGAPAGSTQIGTTQRGGTGGTSTFSTVSAQGGQGGSYGTASWQGYDGASYGEGGLGGARTAAGFYDGNPGQPGWVYVEYGVGVE